MKDDILKMASTPSGKEPTEEAKENKEINEMEDMLDDLI